MTLATDNATLALNPIPTANNGLASGSHTLTASTNVHTGYHLTLLAAAITQPTPLQATAGSFASPVVLANNTWGYAIANTGGFDASYTTPTPNTTSRWASPTTITTVKNTTTATINDQTTIYYAAKADITLPSGTYANTIRYTATANMTDIPVPTITSITPNSGTPLGGTQITIVGTGFTVNDQSVTTGVTLADQNCTNVSISSNTPTAGQDTITCNTPAHAAGAVWVRVFTWRAAANMPNGYTYAAPASISFVSPSTASTIAGTESGPAFTIEGSGFTGATGAAIGGTPCTSFQVVSSTHIFCKAPNTISTTGNKKVVVFKNGTPSTDNITVAYSDTNYPTLQAANAFTQCTTTAKLFRDARDSQLYYVKKMPDEKCWMVDNLKYANYGSLSQVAGKFLTVDGTNNQSTANSDIAKYVDPNTHAYCKGVTIYNMPLNTNTRCGLLYNWYAATNGTGTYAQSTSGTNVTGSICPANFRLPSGYSDGQTATGNGKSFVAADFPVLNASMNAGSLTAGSMTGYPAGWQPIGAWSGTLSGGWNIAFYNQGSNGHYWSSTVLSGTYANYLNFSSISASPGSGAFAKYLGFAVRCVMEDPQAKTGDEIQTVNIDNCPTARTRVVDARDNASYWVQKLADGKCWMLTNLAYGGGGTNTYGDVKTISSGESLGASTTIPYYYVSDLVGSGRTTGTTDPSTSNNGTGQYGYLYNWCAAMGAQAFACANQAGADPNADISICPSGWRLPTGGYGSDFQVMTDAIGATMDGISAGYGANVLKVIWLAMYSGFRTSSVGEEGSRGYYWSSTLYGASNISVLLLDNYSVDLFSYAGKPYGVAVRCVSG